MFRCILLFFALVLTAQLLCVVLVDSAAERESWQRVEQCEYGYGHGELRYCPAELAF